MNFQFPKNFYWGAAASAHQVEGNNTNDWSEWEKNSAKRLANEKDEKRGWFIKESLKNVARTIQEGIDVRGYFYWSFLDNFEWDKGFWPRFGLVEIDYKTMERRIRKSAYEYVKICRNNELEI